MKIERKSNFELLRIFAMLLIVAHHFAVHSGFSFPADTLPPEKLYIQFIQMGGKIGVDIFVLISGYFMSTKSGFNPSKILKFVGQCFFISVVMYVALLASGIIDFSPIEMIKNVFPLTFNKWWFATCYFVLLILSPFINILIKNLSKKSYIKLLAVMMILWCLYPTFTTRSFYLNEFIWFVCLYFIAGYIRKYADDIHIKKSVSIAAIIILTILTYATAVTFDIIGLQHSIYADNALKFYDIQQLPILLLAFFTFMLFKEINIRHNKVVNTIAAASFGVYLIHDNGLIHEFLWKSLAHNDEYSQTMYIVPHSILVILLVYISCTAIDLLRLKLIEPLYVKLINKLVPKVYSIKNNFENKIHKKEQEHV